MSLGPGATGHHPVVSPPCEPVSFVPHLLIEGGQQDVAQQRRDDASLRSSSWSLVATTLVFVTRFQHLLNEPQHSAVGDLLPEKGLVVDRDPRIQNSFSDPHPRSTRFRPPLRARSWLGHRPFCGLFDTQSYLDQRPFQRWAPGGWPGPAGRFGRRPRVCLKLWSCPEIPSSGSLIVAPLAADKSGLGVLDEAVPDFRPD